MNKVPGGGKTTLAGELKDELASGGLRVEVVPMDGYHYERRFLDTFPDPALAHQRRGAPFTFDANRFAKELREGKQALERGEDAFFPSFDHAVKDPVERAIRVPSGTQVVIVEGNYLLLDQEGWSEARDTLDQVYFMQVNLETAKNRLAARHARVWNWPLERAMARVEESDYLNMVLIDATANRAHEIIPDA